MNPFDLRAEISDADKYARAVTHMRSAGVRLPTFAELADPPARLAARASALAGVDPDAADAHNLFRVHWYNDASRRGFTAVPEYLALPSSLTGVDAQIVLALGNRFPMIHAHKVLAAYGCLVPRLVMGTFDPGHDRAVWPSTGNYCRGGIAISRILGCHGVAVLPEGMSRERFNWLERWVTDATDIVRTPGTESNVKEIYDECARLRQDPRNDIINQFSEFSNYLAHRTVTGPALERVFRDVAKGLPGARLAGFVAATGSAGTLAAGDHLKQALDARIVAVEAQECPTLLENGFGEHNIQGIGDKHVPLIHNVMNTDFVVGISDTDTDGLNALFNTGAGRRFLIERKRQPEAVVTALSALGFSGIANVLAAIKVAKYLQLGSSDVMVTVATDGAELYETEKQEWLAEHAGSELDLVQAAEIWGTSLGRVRLDYLVDMTETDRRRMFNLGYYTWVEQQGIAFADFERRRQQSFWDGLTALVPAWDELIERFNRETRLDSA